MCNNVFILSILLKTVTKLFQNIETNFNDNFLYFIGKPGAVGPQGPTGQCDCSGVSNYVHMIAAANAQRAQGNYKGPSSVKGP